MVGGDDDDDSSSDVTLLVVAYAASRGVGISTKGSRRGVSVEDGGGTEDKTGVFHGST